jgi:hypothetical protein
MNHEQVVLLGVAVRDRELTITELTELSRTYEEVRAARLSADRESAKLKKIEDEANTVLIQAARRQGDFIAGPKRYSVGPASFVPHVMDWDALWSHVRATGSFALLEKRPAKAAFQELWDAGVQVPGVEKYPVFKLTSETVKG